MKFLCLIPARKNSKGIKNKNFKIFNKKPLIYWTIKIAKQCKYINRIIVSTDSKKISTYSKKLNVEVPFIRPQNISKDNTDMIDVVKHLIKFTEKEKYNFDALIILQPTSPLRKISDLNKACKIFSKKKWDSLISTIPIPHQFSNNLVLNNRGHFFKLKKKFITLRNNISKKYTSDGGYLFITKKDKLKKYIIGGKIYGYKIDPQHSIDINYKYEFDIAEILMKKMFN